MTEYTVTRADHEGKPLTPEAAARVRERIINAHAWALGVLRKGGQDVTPKRKSA